MTRHDLDASRWAAVIDDLERSWDLAGGNGATATRTADIAGGRLLVRCPDEAVLDHMWPALEHHPPIDGTPDLELRIWQAPPGRTRPRLPTTVLETPECTVVGADGEILGRMGFEIAGGAFMAWDPARRIAWWCVASIDDIPWWNRAAPFKPILAWWLSSRGRHMAHASAVAGDDGGAVLLVGRSGSGKSTTAVTCHLAGMGYIGDDLCLVSVDPEPIVHTLYGSAKLFPHEFEHLDALHPHVVTDDHGVADKLVSVVARRPGASIVTSAPVVAVAAIGVGDDLTTVVEPASMVEVLTALAPSSLLPIPGTSGSTLAAMAEVVRHTPCYRITLGHDRAGVVTAIGALVARAPVAATR